MVTLKEVASKAGVHPSVVSKVVNGKPVNIRQETRERIEKLLKELNYQPNKAAQNLKKGANRTIGMVIPDFYNPVYAEIIHGAEQMAAKKNYSLFVYSMSQKEWQNDYLPVSIKQQIDGMLIATSEIDDQNIIRLMEELPIVLVNRLSQGIQSYVVADDSYGAKLAVQHLIELGHTDIAHISGPLYTGTGLNRLQGYRAALNEHNIPFRPSFMVETPYSLRGGYDAMKQILQAPIKPTALFASNILVSIGALKACAEAGVQIPTELSIVSLHDSEIASMLTPALTTVKLPLHQMGENAVSQLIDLVDGNEQQGTIVYGGELILRNSTKRKKSV
ncbi:LacI family DNA-binding transcriptional regulator [Shouchella lehensis]|uniref:Ribose operon transcriptional repressor n=1 Tax=Shouchella lehensis G1 TaxID=1246626 RepID=A0A060LT09_9BACI|nr:LacI family DNA-binding transcriptional regulator [Shouchella lehensis]AIC94391.1 ribose operon transcriptional repressor [Shouchella lehensis G1]